MKKWLASGLSVLCVVFLFIITPFAEETASGSSLQSFWDAETLDEQLKTLDSYAQERKDELETGGWGNNLTIAAAPGLPDDLIPDDWEEFSYTTEESFPDYMLGHPFVVLYCEDDSRVSLDGDLMARLPEEMRAESMESAEYAMIIRWTLVESDYQYIPPATSYHRDYTAYAVNLKTGERTIFWTQRNGAKSSGQWGHLDGDLLTQEELWKILRPQFLPVLRYEEPDGSALLFVSTGNKCFLNGYEGELTDLIIPTEVDGHKVTGIETSFSGCSGISRVTIEDGTTTLPENLFGGDYQKKLNIACCYVPSSLKGGLLESGIRTDTVIYAPEDSYAADVAAREEYEYVPCSDPEEMPQVETVQEGDFTFRIFRDEAGVLSYDGEEKTVSVPETVNGMPVTSLLSSSFYDKAVVETIVIPQSVRRIARSAIYPDSMMNMQVYLPNPETVLEDYSIRELFTSEPVTIHAPEGSTAEEYVKELGSEGMLFEPWGGEEENDEDPDQRALSETLEMAKKVGRQAAEFWEYNDHEEYSWFANAAEYNYGSPEAVAILRLTKAQYDTLALLMAGEKNVARVFATIVNTQWNLPYAAASAKTAQEGTFKPSADSSCLIAVAAYRKDLVLVTLQGDGSAQAALVCSTPEVVRNLSADYINSIALQYGVSGECTVYDREMLEDMDLSED